MKPDCDRLPNDLLAANARGWTPQGVQRSKHLLTLVILVSLVLSFRSDATTEEASPEGAEVISKENAVDAAHANTEWQPASIGQKLVWHDRLRTGEDSRAALRFGDLSILRVDEFFEGEILPPTTAGEKPTLDLKQGSAYFFSREKSQEVNVRTPAANGGIRGTEFVVTAKATDGGVSFVVIDGEVEVSNSNGSVVVRGGERADTEIGGTPTKTKASHSLDSARWCFYYPGVLDPKEVMDSLPDRDPLQASLSAYGEGDLLKALEQYPHARLPTSPGEKVYRASLFLIAGQAAKAEGLLNELDHNLPNRRAISTLIAAVTSKKDKAITPPGTASEWMAESYYRQSQGDLKGASQAAERATAIDPDFGFGWTRLAEVEFSRGRISPAKEALAKGLTLAPNNPAAHALRGSVLSAEGKCDEAITSFEKAMALDSALGDAWAGRGLCLIRQGQVKAGRRDLFTAAALEPNRKIFRKYLADALGNSDRESTTGKGHSAGSGVANGSKRSSSPKPAQATNNPPNNANSEPVYQGRMPGSGTNINPPGYPIVIPLPGGNPNPRSAGSGTTSHPEQGGDRTPAPGKGSHHPTPSRHPEQDKPTRQPAPSPPEGRTFVPRLPADQGQTIRKKKPTPNQSPTPN